MAALWDLFVQIKGDGSGYKKTLSDAARDTEQFAASSESVANRVSAIGGKLLAGIGFSALGAGAIAAANKFDQAFVQIQRSTGATGEKLKGLQDSFSAVYKQTDQSSQQVTAALTMLSTRTQAAGKDLESLTLATIRLSKTQREDVTQIVPVVTRAFGDWSIASDKQARAMDYLRVVSQQTGAGVSKLAETVVYAGAPLRMLGYSFDQAAALIGRFEKEGVNTELVLGGMKAALQKFAKDGVTDTAGAWREFVAGVKSGSITLSDALALVGAKRGPDLYRAIVEGRFEIDETVKSAQNLATKGGEAMETMQGKVTKLWHSVESLAGAHYQLITTIGLTYPAWSSVASTVGPLIGGLIAKLVGAGGATAAVTTLANSTLALGGTFTTAGSTIAAAGVTANAGWLALAGTIAGIALVIGAVGAGAVAVANSYKEHPLDPKTHTPAGGTFSGFGFTPDRMPVIAGPSAPRGAPSAPDWAFVGSKPAPVRTPAPSGNTFHPYTIGESIAADQLQAAISRTKQRLEDFYAAGLDGGKKLSVTMSDMTSHVLDFSVAADASGASVAKIAEVDWSQCVTGISKTDELMRRLGVTSTHSLRQAYEVSLVIANAVAEQYAAGYATLQDVESASAVAEKAGRDLQHNIDGTTEATKRATKEGINFGRQVSTVLTDLSRSLADCVFGTKSIGDAFKDVGKAIVRIILEDIIAGAIGKLMNALSGVFQHLNGLGKAIGSIFGTGASAGASAAGSAIAGTGSAAGSAVGGIGSVGSVASSGLANTIGAAAGVASAVSGVIGNFQMAGMNKSLDLIEKSARYSEIYLGGNGYESIFGFTKQTWQTLVDIKGYLWSVQAEYLRQINDTVTWGKGGGGGKGGLTFNNCTFTGSPDQIANSIFNQAALAGAL